MTTVNYYDVLDLKQDATPQEIKESYRKLALIWHPDKKTGNAEMFELITHAYNILIDGTTRSDYDTSYNISKQAEIDHFDLKSQSLDYITAQETDITKKKSKPDQSADFNKAFEEMDRKHGYKRESEKTKISETEITSLMKELQATRELDDIENIHDNLFDGKFQLGKFNKAFDEIYKPGTDMIPHVGNPNPWNQDNLNNNYSTLDNYDKLYDDNSEIGGTLYGSVKQEQTKLTSKKLSKSDIENLSEADYVTGHNYKDDNYNKTLEEKIKERDLETKKLSERSLQDFDKDPSCGGYGFIAGINPNGNLIEDDDDLKTKYAKLLEARKKI